MGSLVLSPNLLAILGRNAELMSRLEETADQILEAAKAYVPVDTGALQDSGRVEAEEAGEGVSVKVVFGDDNTTNDSGMNYAAFVEFGTETTPTFAFLRRAGESLGLALKSARR